MSTQTRELLDLCERLPETERAEVADFARFLLARPSRATTGAGDGSAGATPNDLFAEMEPSAVDVAGVDDSRQAIYAPAEGEE